MSQTILHVGCGGAPLPDWLSEFEEVRLDINPDCEPDIVAPMTDMGDIGPFDRIYCSHALEHLHPIDVQTALGEFLRVLKPGGAVLAFVPDLEDVKPTEEVLYISSAGPITGRDMYYGLARITQEQPYMAHKTGFTAATLESAMLGAGFARVKTRRCYGYNLFGAAVKA